MLATLAGHARTAERPRSPSLPVCRGLAASVPRKPLGGPQPFPQRLVEAGEEVGHDPVAPIRLQQHLKVKKLLDDQERAELLGGVENLLRHGAGFVRFAPGDEHGDEDELSEGPAPCPIPRPKVDDGFGLTLPFPPAAELTRTA